MSDRIITGFRCPKCEEESLTYNGNYYCTNHNCDWANPEVDIPIKAQSTWILRLMHAYMFDNQKNGEWQNYIDPIREELDRRG